ncbi:hypothetical protein RUM43_008238 [Polyplax serrata]|uniref:Uncharacterized protein n=1 Tax=Polyplax serrata TaxID=468196 RepID=A0AAN8SAB9_POLSC
MGLTTSEYSRLLCPDSFRHNKNLNTNTKVRTLKLQVVQRNPFLTCPHRYMRINTITQNDSSKQKASKKVKTVREIMLSQISNTEIPKKLITSLSVKNMSGNLVPINLPKQEPLSTRELSFFFWSDF